MVCKNWFRGQRVVGMVLLLSVILSVGLYWKDRFDYWNSQPRWILYETWGNTKYVKATYKTIKETLWITEGQELVDMFFVYNGNLSNEMMFVGFPAAWLIFAIFDVILSEESAILRYLGNKLDSGE